MRKRIKAAEFAMYGITKDMVFFAKQNAARKGYANKRPTWYYDYGLLYAEVHDYGSSCCVYSKGTYMGQD